jgi:hypothetical protein
MWPGKGFCALGNGLQRHAELALLFGLDRLAAPVTSGVTRGGSILSDCVLYKLTTLSESIQPVCMDESQ